MSRNEQQDLHYMVLLARNLLLCTLLLGVSSAWTGVRAQEAETEQENSTEPRVRRLGDVTGSEYQIDLSVPQPTEQPQTSRYDLPDASQALVLESLMSTLAAHPGDTEAMSQLDSLLSDLIGQANRLIDRRNFRDAGRIIQTVDRVDPRKDGLASARNRLAASDTGRNTGGQLKAGNQRRSVLDLPAESQNQRLQALLGKLAAQPGHSATLRELDQLLSTLISQSENYMSQGQFQQAEQTLNVVREVNPRKEGLAEAMTRLDKAREVEVWLQQGERAESRGVLTEPLINSAFYFYRKVLAVDGRNQRAKDGLLRIQKVFTDEAIDAAYQLDFDLSDELMAEAEDMIENPGLISTARLEVDALRTSYAEDIEVKVIESIEAGNLDLAEFTLIDLIALGGHEDRVSFLRGLMQRRQRSGSFDTGQIIQDEIRDLNAYGPALTVIAAGTFLMGSPENERDRNDNESPQHRVTLREGFAIGTTEVTVAQFKLFIEDTAFITEAEAKKTSTIWDDNLGRLNERKRVNWRHNFTGDLAQDNLPVLHVTWSDAQAYLGWLSRKTGETYRLPSEAEFEFALRGGTQTAYWWGQTGPTERYENLAGQNDVSESGRKFSEGFDSYRDGNFGPAIVGSFEANGFGLFDIGGNVSEWTQDCWHPNYVRAPTDGSTWENPGCQRRVVRGAYWASSSRQARSASRMSAPQSLHGPQLGFRVVREL